MFCCTNITHGILEMSWLVLAAKDAKQSGASLVGDQDQFHLSAMRNTV